MRRSIVLVTLGVILSLSGATGPIGAEGSIAEQEVNARKNTVQAAPANPSHETPLPRFWGNRTGVPAQVVQRPQARRSSAVIIPVQQPPATQKRALLPVVDQPGIGQRQKEIADDVLRLLPATCLRHLDNFYVRYDNPERRGLAGRSVVILDGTLPDNEFRSVLIHEALGHFFDLGCLQGSLWSGASDFRDGSEIIFQDDPSVQFYRISWSDATTKHRASQTSDFVSGYAVTDPFEDLAESIAYALLHRADFAKRAAGNPALAAKLQWIDANLPAGTANLASGSQLWNGSIPWDITKLPYTWIAASQVAQK